MSRNTQFLTILAQDPSVRSNGELVLAKVEVAQERLGSGPKGYRVKVVDFDATANVLYKPLKYAYGKDGVVIDLFVLPDVSLSPHERLEFETKLLSNPNFHAQHTYAIVMRVLARFEFALGRRVKWGFNGHQLHIAPHAFCEANAFYSKEDHALFFGYFWNNKNEPVFTCLSHDIVAHEATHALLDGLRNRYSDPSGPDQAAFHEGFSDVIAILSMFSLKPVVELALIKELSNIQKNGEIRLISGERLTSEAIADSILFGIGKEFGQQLDGIRANALRRSVSLKVNKQGLKNLTNLEEHDRGEIFASAFLKSFLEIWVKRIAQLGTFGKNKYNLDMVIEEGVKVAEQLMTMAIRAIDYCPPVDIEFSHYLAALLTVDGEVAPDDSRYGYRATLLQCFSDHGIESPAGRVDKSGSWMPFVPAEALVYYKTNFESMLRDQEEVFRFVWENRDALNLDDRGYLMVTSVRPSSRQGPDGFILKETICEYVQMIDIFGAEVESVLKFKRPEGMSSKDRYRAYGGGVLVFDQYGQIKFHIEQRLDNIKAQSSRLNFLLENGYLNQTTDDRNQFAMMHRKRAQNKEGA